MKPIDLYNDICGLQARIRRLRQELLDAETLLQDTERRLEQNLPNGLHKIDDHHMLLVIKGAAPRVLPVIDGYLSNGPLTVGGEPQ